MNERTGILAVAALLASGCVTKGSYDKAVQDAASAHADAATCATDDASAHAEVARLNDALTTAKALADQRDHGLATAQANSADLQKKLDDAIAENAQLRNELTRLGKNVDAMLAEKGTMASALAQAKSRLDELRTAQAAAEARAAAFRDLATKFQRMVDAGQLKIVLRNGRMVIQLANDILFDSGKTEIKTDGKQALAQVATVLMTIPNRHFQVAGDTDNVPIQTSHFPSNWELSTERAVQVVRFLVAQGLKPEVLSAAGYGEFDPIAPNDTPASRAKNRRTEISLQPNIDELVALPEGK